MYELACFLSSLMVDVFPVTMQRQALAVLFVLTVEVPQIQFFDVVGFWFLGMWVYIDKSLMCQGSCKGRFQLLSVCYGGRGRILRIPTRSLALSALGPCTLLLRTFVLGRHLPRCPRASLRLVLEECHSVRHGCAGPFALEIWTPLSHPAASVVLLLRISWFDSGCMFLSFLVGFWTNFQYFFVTGSSDPPVDSRLALSC